MDKKQKEIKMIRKNAKERHIIITGSHRSGTTWIGRTISQIEETKYIEEPFNVTWSNRFVGFQSVVWFEQYQSSNQKRVLAEKFKFLKHGKFRHSINYLKTQKPSIFTPLRLIKYSITGETRKRYIIKDPIALFSAEWLYENHDLDVVCTIRRPYGFVASLKKANWDFDFSNIIQQEYLINGLLKPFKDTITRIPSSDDFYIKRCCLLWNILHYQILKYRNKHKDWLFVEYEKLAENPQTEFKRIFNHLNLNMDRHIIDYIDTKTSGNNIPNNSTNFRTRDPQEALNSWRVLLTESEKKQIKEMTLDLEKALYGDQEDIKPV